MCCGVICKYQQRVPIWDQHFSSMNTLESRTACAGAVPCSPSLSVSFNPYPVSRSPEKVIGARRALLTATSSSVNQYTNSRPCRSGFCLTAPSLSATGREVLMTLLVAEDELLVPYCYQLLGVCGVRARGSERSRHMRRGFVLWSIEKVAMLGLHL